MTLWLVLYNIELENTSFKVGNFYVFVSLVQTIDELKAVHKKVIFLYGILSSMYCVAT